MEGGGKKYSQTDKTEKDTETETERHGEAVSSAHLHHYLGPTTTSNLCSSIGEAVSSAHLHHFSGPTYIPPSNLYEVRRKKSILRSATRCTKIGKLGTPPRLE